MGLLQVAVPGQVGIVLGHPEFVASRATPGMLLAVFGAVSCLRIRLTRRDPRTARAIPAILGLTTLVLRGIPGLRILVLQVPPARVTNHRIS